jgi:hypothetical protein
VGIDDVEAAHHRIVQIDGFVLEYRPVDELLAGEITVGDT